MTPPPASANSHCNHGYAHGRCPHGCGIYRRISLKEALMIATKRENALRPQTRAKRASNTPEIREARRLASQRRRERLTHTTPAQHAHRERMRAAKHAARMERELRHLAQAARVIRRTIPSHWTAPPLPSRTDNWRTPQPRARAEG